MCHCRARSRCLVCVSPCRPPRCLSEQHGGWGVGGGEANVRGSWWPTVRRSELPARKPGRAGVLTWSQLSRWQGRVAHIGSGTRGRKSLDKNLQMNTLQPAYPLLPLCRFRGFWRENGFSDGREKAAGRPVLSLVSGGAAGSAGGRRARPLPFTLARTLVLPCPCGHRVCEAMRPPRKKRSLCSSGVPGVRAVLLSARAPPPPQEAKRAGSSLKSTTDANLSLTRSLPNCPNGLG